VRQWGKAMHDDLEDGVDHLAREGLIDPSRVCLYGASYGGYATLWGLVKTPDKYKCGVAALVVSDIRGFLTSTQTDFAKNIHDESGVNFWKKMVGDPSSEAALLNSISPAFHASKIKAPVFIISGQDDARTPIEQAELMRKALREAGKEPEWMVAAEEGHGFAKAENRYEMYTRMLKFLDKNLGMARQDGGAGMSR
jgi:dipeptidyl aminopeptidase/acylaminoacyl peptidase